MIENTLNKNAQVCLQKLLRIWFDFEKQLIQVPIIRRLENGTFTKNDYLLLLLHLRQQVIEGSRWISRCASSFDRSFSDVRSEVIHHAKDEHLDYLMIESDYASLGGDKTKIQSGERNIGSEALHGYLMYKSSQPNPIDLIGAMWIVEGLGQKMAHGWATRIEELLLVKNATTFMEYHGENDDVHMEKLYKLLDLACTDESISESIQKTAQTVARLYLLQLEDIHE